MLISHIPINQQGQNVTAVSRDIFIRPMQSSSYAYRVHKFDACGGVRISSANQ